MQSAKINFEMDYWGLSYRQALEYILKVDNNPLIKFQSNDEGGRFNTFILPKNQAKRLRYVSNQERAKYFISNYRFHPGEYDMGNEFFSIKVNGARIMVVYKLQ